MLKYILSSFLIIIFSCNSCYAEPNISAVTVSDSTIAISGSLFSSHGDNNATQDYLQFTFLDMEGGTIDSSFYDCSAFGEELVVGATNKANSSYSARGYRWTTEHTWTSICGIERTALYQYRGDSIDLGGDREKVFASVWYYLPVGYYQALVDDQSIPQGHKFLVFGYNNGDAGKLFYSSGVSSGTTPNFGTSVEGNSLAQIVPALDWVQEGEWCRFDTYVDVAPADPNKKHTWWINGKVVRDDFFLDGFPNMIDKIAPIGYYAESSDTLIHMQHWDDVFIDFTMARVEICDHATWDDTIQKHCEIQLPTAWSDTEITATINQGSLPDGDYYLFVVDEDNVASTGYPITFGSTQTSVRVTGNIKIQ